MPGLIRRIFVFAAVDGLLLQSPPSSEPHTALRIEYKSQKLTSVPSISAEDYGKKPHLESHGIIGLLSVASTSFLIAITGREQVAQIFGKPVYVVTDVALLPLSSQSEAEKAVAAAVHQRDATAGTEDDSSDAGSTADDSNDVHSAGDVQEAPSPTDDVRSKSDKDETTATTNIAEDVFSRRGPYGKFASQWLIKKGWGIPGIGAPRKIAEIAPGSTQSANPASLQQQQPVNSVRVVTSSPDTGGPNVEQTRQSRPVGQDANDATPGEKDTAIPLLPKLLRSTRLILSSRSFYFSYDFNLTRRLGDPRMLNAKPLGHEDIDPRYFWNRYLGSPFSNAGFHPFLMPIMQGFVGQRHFVVKKNFQQHTNTEVFHAVEGVLNADQTQATNKQSTPPTDCNQPFLLTLVSRRSTQRSGLRYLRRGIDDSGNCANTVETEQILSSPTWERSAKYRCFVQIRGSVPLYFSQSPYAFKPVPILHQSIETNQTAFLRHFDDLRKRYGSVQIALLVDKHGSEAKIGEEYEQMTQKTNKRKDTTPLGFEWFDFHAECRGMKFENVAKLVNTLRKTIKALGESVVQDGEFRQSQTGIIRSNCMDCLDRTNVAQSAFAQFMLQNDLEEEGFEIDLFHDESTQWFNTLWADNGDAISRQYASTAALKGDFTRTRKRDYRGALNDFGLTMTRYYNNMFNDYFSQAVIDFLLGNVSAKVFADFETNMMSADPGISVEKIREQAIETCRKIVIQAPDEDLIHAWPMLTPAQPNTLRTLPFEESVLLLTDTAIYSCRFDWTTEKVLAYEKIDLRAITSIHYGTYITSTFTERQMDEAENVGIAILYTPGKESFMRVNTRSLSNSFEEDTTTRKAGKDDLSSGISSWLGSRAQPSTQTMALKLISNDTAQQTDAGKANNSLLNSAQQICEDLQRAISAERNVQMVQKTDIISLEEARKRVGYLEQLSHSIKKFVWT